MRRIESRAPGGPETLVLAEAPAPQPTGDEVVIDVAVCGINYPDVLIIEDLYQLRPPRPFGGGIDSIVVVEHRQHQDDGLRAGLGDPAQTPQAVGGVDRPAETLDVDFEGVRLLGYDLACDDEPPGCRLVLYDVRVQTLIVESDGRVVGIRCRRFGATVDVRARRGVVLATGSFAYNDAMVARYAPRIAVWSPGGRALLDRPRAGARRPGRDRRGAGPVSARGQLAGDRPAADPTDGL